MSRQKSIVSKIQIGKNGITKNFIETLKSYFKKHTIVKISVLKNNLDEFDNKKEKIKEMLGDKYIYAHQSEPLGTGHAVASAKDSVHPEHKTVLILSSDQPLISKTTIERLLQKHNEKKPTITIATVSVPDFEEWRSSMRHFGRIVRNGDGTVKEIVEFKDATEKEKMLKELNPAVYAFDSDWLWKNINLIKNENVQKEYYLTDLIKMARDQDKKIEAIPVANLMEGLQPNSKEELEILEKFAV